METMRKRLSQLGNTVIYAGPTSMQHPYQATLTTHFHTSHTSGNGSCPTCRC